MFGGAGAAVGAEVEQHGAARWQLAVAARQECRQLTERRLVE